MAKKATASVIDGLLLNVALINKTSPNRAKIKKIGW